MADCQHILPDPRERCPHAAVAEGDRCLWHSPRIPKHQPYVAEVFRRADAAGGGRFAGAHLAGLHLADLDLRGRDLRGADLRDAVLDGCDLGAADLRGANLRRASLRHARLVGANLGGADLGGANLSGADLREVDFSSAIIAGTVLNAADLRGANLKGARITDFHWNRLTRFAGVRGLEAEGQEAGHDSTQVFPAPLALGDQDLDSGERLALEPDPALERTRLFTLAAPRPAEAAPAAAPAAAPPRSARAWRGWLVPCLAGAALVAAAWGASAAAVRHRQPPAPTPDHAAALAQFELQHRADLAELAHLQRQLADQEAELARSGQQRAAAAGDQERLRALLTDQDAELDRLRGADDRAAVLALRVGELEGLSRDLARQSARQDHIARILADGLEERRGEAEGLTRTLADLRARTADAERDHADAVRLRQDLAALRQERDALQDLYQRSSDELRTAQRDIQRYLARVNASNLQGMLSDEDGGPLLRVEAGRPLALGGDFLVSLQVDRGEPGRDRVQVRLVVQRPAAAANPDATVVLYDGERRPLRRLSFSFPHVDAGAPFVSATATVSCDRFPAQARVLLVPGDATVAAR